MCNKKYRLLPLCLASMLVSASSAMAASASVKVDTIPGDGWAVSTTTTGAAFDLPYNLDLPPPAGIGSLSLTVDTAADAVILGDTTTLASGTHLLATLTGSFSTLVPMTGDPTWAPVLQLVMYQDTGGVNATILNIAPSLQFFPTPVIPGAWQTWTLDPLFTMVWQSNDYGDGCNQATPCPLLTLQTLHPNAYVTGVQVALGPNILTAPATGNIDFINIGDGVDTFTWDFEPPPVAPPQAGGQTSQGTVSVVPISTGGDHLTAMANFFPNVGDQGKPGSIFVFVYLPDTATLYPNGILMLDSARNWHVFTDCRTATVVNSGVLEATSDIQIMDAPINRNSLHGAELYIGYGVGSPSGPSGEACNNMVANKTWVKLFTLP